MKQWLFEGSTLQAFPTQIKIDRDLFWIGIISSRKKKTNPILRLTTLNFKTKKGG